MGHIAKDLTSTSGATVVPEENIRNNNTALMQHGQTERAVGNGMEPPELLHSKSEPTMPAGKTAWDEAKEGGEEGELEEEKHHKKR